MNIILSEEHTPGNASPEKEFSKNCIVFGRDADASDVTFDSVRYPMVSRHHAELRWQNGKWYLIDHGSSYGTFLDGERLSKPRPVSAGSRMQFGIDGPIIRVVWFEEFVESGRVSPSGSSSVSQMAAAEAHKPKTVHPVKSDSSPSDRMRPILPPARLERIDGPQISADIKAGETWLGRDPSCQMIFDASAATVSRKHAVIRSVGADYFLSDNNSFNGTLVNDQRIASDVPLYDGDEIRLGLGGPVVKFVCPGRPSTAGTALAGQRSFAGSSSDLAVKEGGPKTIVFKMDGVASASRSGKGGVSPQLLLSVTFGDSGIIRIGRDETNDIRLDGLQISKFHARLQRTASGIIVEDLGSTNGVFLNGSRINKAGVAISDEMQIGSFILRVDESGTVSVFDTRSKTRVDCVNITREVRNRAGSGKIKLLDDVSLSIQPNEFVGLLGPSGAGKSTLIEALNGVRPATSGYVRINNLDLYRNLDSLKQSIGYVPQEDIIHRELSVFRTLYYVAKLRLPSDVSRKEIVRIIEEVLDVTGLSERRNVAVSDLSGGQRKRVSMAVELITKPSVIFLDEPTSGLDPATEDKIMNLFRQIAESGRTVIMTTHAMENVGLFDKIVVLMRGKLVFFGTPNDALKHLGASSFKQLYDRLETPASDGSGAANSISSEGLAEEWKQSYLKTSQYSELIKKPLSEITSIPSTGRRSRSRLGLFGSFRQFFNLSRRYFEVLLKDKLNLAILLLQAPIIALMTFLVMGGKSPRDFVYFVLALVSIWFGTSVSAREIIRERPVYRRERMFNLGIIPYLTSKLFVLWVIVFIQCLMLFVPLKFFDLIGAMPMPGELLGIPQFWTMLLTASVGIALGLLISALFKTQEIATSLVPLILIPQILFSGLVGVPQGINKVVGLTMPAAWSFDTMKRFSTLETLESEGAMPGDSTKGLGLYKFIEKANDETLAKAERDLADYKQMSGGANPVDEQGNPTPLAERLKVPEIRKIPDDLSGYVTFMHPWMNEVLNQMVLMLMFWILVFFTLIVLKLRDAR